SKVQVFTLDPETSRKRNSRPDQEVYLYADQIEPEDILPLQDTLRLNQTAAESAYLLKKTYGRSWLRTLLDHDSMSELAEEIGANEASLSAFRRKMGFFDRLGFLKKESVKGRDDVLQGFLDVLKQGKSIVLEFGRYSDLTTYMLVANVITRRLREAYEDMTLVYNRTQNEADKPHPLIITIEEAHKFLSPGIARETPFGKIAREMRKFFVSLLVVDQRPSAIDEEVLSQIGTKIVAQLNDEKDIGAALVGTSGASALRQVLASLDSKQQALLLGHAFPMPVVVQTRTYDEEFFAAMQDEAFVGASFASVKDQTDGLF
ncbi:MAG: ATP-binding protein, partial [Bacteroidota bacterium]